MNIITSSNSEDFFISYETGKTGLRDSFPSRFGYRENTDTYQRIQTFKVAGMPTQLRFDFRARRHLLNFE